MSITLTLDQLRKAGACRRVLDKLQATYGDKRTFRKPETLAKALEKSGYTSWFAVRMLHPSLRDEYERQRVLLWGEYERQQTLLWGEYERQRAPLRDEYERQIAPLRDKYLRRRTLLRDEYERQIAYAAATLYFQQESN